AGTFASPVRHRGMAPLAAGHRDRHLGPDLPGNRSLDALFGCIIHAHCHDAKPRYLALGQRALDALQHVLALEYAGGDRTDRDDRLARAAFFERDAQIAQDLAASLATRAPR